MPPPWKRSVAAAAAACLLWGGCTSTPEISRENGRKIRTYWDHYCKSSPEWEGDRAAWLNMGAPEKKALADLLILDLLKNSASQRPDALGNPQPGWRRPARELALMGDEAVEPLLDVLSRSRDETAVPACIEALAGTARAARILEAFEDPGGENPDRYRSRLVRTLVKTEDPRAISFLLGILAGDYAWRVRATAASALGAYEGPFLDEVVAALRKVRSDPDPFIAERAKASLTALEERGARE